MAKINYRICLFLATAWTAVFVVYFPGLHGPFVFDDYGNILNNHFIRIKNLDLDSLYYSSFSGFAGPLRRPVAMLSFALNYFFSDGTNSTFAYKATNIAIHALSASLVLIVITQLHTRYRMVALKQRPVTDTNPLYFALAITLIWALHPINVTSVLYVVQRMTTLSGLFSLASIAAYLYARNSLTGSSFFKSVIGFAGCIICWLLALYSKENAVVLPLLLLSVELTLYPSASPWRHYHSLSLVQKRIMGIIVLAASLGFLAYSIQYALPAYGGRNFTMVERVLTEARVLCFYISLIVIPRINAFGLFHDDIVISNSLLAPPTTLLSIFALMALLAVAYKIRHRHPLVTLGIFWFFIGHLLESTIFALEITHEHRNYLPSIGIILAAGSLCSHYLSNRPNKLLAISCGICLIVGGTSWMRASQWQDLHHLAEYESRHNPGSSATQTLLAHSLYVRGDKQGSAAATLRAAEINPNEPMYLLNLKLLENDGIDIPPDTHQKILSLLSKKYPSAASQMALDRITSCVTTEACTKLQPELLEWLDVIIQTYGANPSASSYFYHLKGKALKSDKRYVDALNAFQQASDSDPKYLHPLVEMMDILLRMKNIEQAERVFSLLENANQTNTHPQDEAVDKFREVLEQLKAEKNHAPAAS